MTEVAPRKSTCTICTPGNNAAAVFQDVNAAVWDGRPPSVANRVPGYRVAGRAAAAAHGLEIDARTITRHAEHVEATARVPTRQKPQVGRELEIYPQDFVGVTDRFTQVGLTALARLEERVSEGDVETKDLVAASKLGLQASSNRKAAEQRDAALRKGANLDDPRLTAIFIVGSGHAPAIPSGMALNVTPIEDMRDLLRQEREASEALARG